MSNKYIVITADKGSYARAIEINDGIICNTYTEALNELKGWIWVIEIREKLDEIIKNKEEYVEDSYDDVHYFEYEEDKLIYYSNGCRATNEYDGHSCKIIKLGE